MRLIKVTIEGYRSARGPLELHVDDHVTVILGANDHGKSNLLKALLHLNPDQPFDGDEDLDWDCSSESNDSLPTITYELKFSAEESSTLRLQEQLSRERQAIETWLETERNDRQAANEWLTTLQSQAAGAATQSTDSVDPQPNDADEQQDGTSTDEPSDHSSEASGENIEAAEIGKQLETAEQESRVATQRVAVGHARLIEIDARMRGESEEDALTRALETAETQARITNETHSAANAEKKEAVTAFNTGKEQYAEDSTEYRELDEAALAATKKSEAAAKMAAERDDHVSHIRQTIEARQVWMEEPEGSRVILPGPQVVSLKEVPERIQCKRHGIDGELSVASEAFEQAVFEQFVFARLPRVLLVPPVDKVPDSVSREELQSDDAVFMRGIFHYAGLQPEEWDSIFDQNDRTTRRLADASAILNETLSKSWTQGQKLGFMLDHDSGAKRINLRINDPAVNSRYVRASRRSSGFTHFFALKTILHAYQQESAASTYIWAFDEPGVFLHPDGQYDLVQVMETLAQANQIVYSTHSIFMANKNFPARHRLVVKSAKGSHIDGKPFRSRWRPAIEALGMSLPGTLLFASRVLLVEGDSDVILINATLQKLIEMGELRHDVNSLAVLATGDTADAVALVRMLSQGPNTPLLAALFDGDDGGRRRAQALEKLRMKNLVIHRLTVPETSIEDHLPFSLELYPKALAEYLAKMSPRALQNESSLDVNTILDEILDRRDKLVTTKDGLTRGMAPWSREIGRQVGQLDEDPSSVGIAREYAHLLQDTDPATGRKGALKRSREVADWIARELKLPDLTLSQQAITSESTAVAD